MKKVAKKEKESGLKEKESNGSKKGINMTLNNENRCANDVISLYFNY